MKMAIYILLLLVIPSVSYAGNCRNCTVKFVGCSYKYGNTEHCNVFFKESIVDRDAGSCYASSDNRMAFDITKEAGKAILAIALSAQASGQKVMAYGARNCDVLPPYETINLLYIGNFD